MDSWETARHNPKACDEAVFALKESCIPRYVYNFNSVASGKSRALYLSLWMCVQGEWEEILAKTSLDGHAEKRIKLDTKINNISKLRVRIYPDGGLSRLYLFSELPEGQVSRYEAPSIV